MWFCPPNISFGTIWYQGGFSPCFIDTMTGILLGCLMLVFGSGEMFLYWRYGTPAENVAQRSRRYLYFLQLAANGLLVLIPFVWLALRIWQNNYFYGFSIFYNVICWYAWSMSLALTFLERNFDLPASPARGHSVSLNIFWATALALDSLTFVNFNGQAWYFIVHDEKDRALLVVFILKWLCEVVVFILGMIAPGMVGADLRSQFFYRPLGETSCIKYGSTSSVETNIGMGVCADLTTSMELLREQLYSGELVLSFRRLDRQPPGVSFDAARLPANTNKNRYFNVLPYDFNRVLLRKSPSTDYINASAIMLRLAGEGTEKRYVAAQGPLKNTVADFWRMVAEQQMQTIVMLTDLNEAGVSKCYQYWPNEKETLELGDLLVSCLRVDEDRHAAATVRDFILMDLTKQMELEVVQIQYRGWPDHGVPKKPLLFLDFMDLVTASKPETSSPSSPVLVHCSAGIGRTGVYIVVEAMCDLADRGEPIRPLELVKQLRTQRMGMLQTEEQLVFACEAFLKYFERKKCSF